jgi:hypothetical protein
VLTRPQNLSDAMVVGALSSGWEISVASLEYRAVGFGSHHWRVTDTAGVEWFATVDDIDSKLLSARDTIDEARERLRAALATARALRDAGLDFVVAPIPGRAGEIVWRISDRFVLALYPYIDGISRSGAYESTSERLAVLELIVAVHTVPRHVSRGARIDDFEIQQRDALERALGDLVVPRNDGPYSQPARTLLSRHAGAIGRCLAHYDRLVEEARAQTDRIVLTHGELHVENVMHAAAGRLLIDWDTTSGSLPERDLWMLESGDGSIGAAYAERTGTEVATSMLDLYRLGWDLVEVAIYAAQFRRPHTECADTREAWESLEYSLDRLADRP